MTSNSQDVTMAIDVNLIDVHPMAFKREQGSEDIHALLRNIDEFGVLQTPRVRKKLDDSGRYELFIGEAEFTAWKEQGNSHIECTVCSRSEKNESFMLQRMVMESCNGIKPSEYEVALRVERIAAMEGSSIAKVGKRLGFSDDRCQNYQSLISAPEFVKGLSIKNVSNDLRGLAEISRAVKKLPEVEEAVKLLAEDGVSGRKIGVEVKRLLDSGMSKDLDETGMAVELVQRLGFSPMQLTNKDRQWDNVLGTFVAQQKSEQLKYRAKNETDEEDEDEDEDRPYDMAPTVYAGQEDNEEHDDFSAGLDQVKRATKKKASDTEPKIRIAVALDIEPILVTYKEKKMKGGKTFKPEDELGLLIWVDTGGSMLKFRIDHTTGMQMLVKAADLRDKIARGEEGERKRIECSSSARKKAEEAEYDD